MSNLYQNFVDTLGFSKVPREFNDQVPSEIPKNDDPYSGLQKKNFKLYQRVRFVNLPKNCELENNRGIILGTSLVNVTDHYIVLLAKSTKTHLAISITEACLEAI